MQTTRRTVLASVGTVALAGCMGDNTDDLESERDTAKADLTGGLYRYGYTLIAQANEQYNTGTELWNIEDYYGSITDCERAYGLYASASAATEQCTDAATEQSRSQAVHDMIDETTDYADTMGDASRDLAYAAKAATRDEWGEADSYHAQAADAADSVSLSTLTEPDQFVSDL